MSYDDGFYTDEPLATSPRPSPKGEGDAKPNDARSLWDYVASPQTSGGEDSVWDYASPSLLGEGRAEVLSQRDVPSDISMLLSMIRKDYWSITSTKSFYEQALFMAGYEDDFEILPFNSYYPTYRQMSYGQLRSYFTIRKLLRQGQHPDVPLSYLYVYAYEILMQIGIDNPEDGYQILCDLRDSYPLMNPAKKPYLSEWLRDYVVWYGLSDHYADCFSEEQRKDKDCLTLSNCSKASDEDFFKALDDNARHCITKGVLYKKNRQAAIKGVAGIMRSLAPVIEEHFGNRLGILCLGHHSMSQHIMFSTAVFYVPEPIREASAEVTPLHKYVCHKGLWKVTTDSVNIALPPRYLSYILHDVDAAIRERIGLKPSIKTKYIHPGSYLADELPMAANTWFSKWKAEAEEQKRKERQEALQKARASVSIDLTKLGAIREDADVVRDKLIVDEEDLSLSPYPTGRGAAKTASPITVPATDKPEETFIKLLLEDGDYRAFLRSVHTPAGVMVENINDKAMDVIGDIVLEDDGENITVIDDYREDIKHLYE